jgi:hypothetical protein
MLSLRQITAQGVTAFVAVGFLKACLKLNCLLTALILQHLPCMSNSFCGLFECGLGRFPKFKRDLILTLNTQVSLIFMLNGVIWLILAIHAKAVTMIRCDSCHAKSVAWMNCVTSPGFMM